MKRSKKIQLAVLTSLVASCNHSIINMRQPIVAGFDSSLLKAPPSEDSAYNYSFTQCDCVTEEQNKQITGQSFYIAPMNVSYYAPTKRDERQFVWKGDNFVVKGGFGKSAYSSSSTGS